MCYNIAVFSGGYLPGFKGGGPIVSISRIIDSEAPHQFNLITSNHDLGDAQPYPGFEARTWKKVGRANVAYLRPHAVDIPWIIKQLRTEPPDSYYINSLHSPWFSLLPLLGIKLRIIPKKPVLLATRGETSKGALELKSRKKNAWRPIIKWLIGPKITWHFTSRDEQKEVQSWWGGKYPSNHEFIIQSNPAVRPYMHASAGPKSDIPVIVFASRIDPKKGLDEAIRIISRLDFPVKFHVYGTVTDENYWRQCQARASNDLPAGMMIYKGPYFPTNAQEIFSTASLFLFPTKGENFGHAIAEALSVGCPVVISDSTPWTETIRSGAGYILPETNDIWKARLQESPEHRLLNREVVLATYTNWFAKNQNYESMFTASLNREFQA